MQYVILTTVLIVLALQIGSGFIWARLSREAKEAYHERALDAERQLTDVLDRISTSERIDLAAAAPPPVEPGALRYIPDTPDADARWNEFRKTSDEELEAVAP